MVAFSRLSAALVLVLGVIPGCGSSSGNDGGLFDATTGPLTAVVSPDRTVIGGLVVKLDGSSSTGASSYQWAQTTGPSLNIGGADEAIAWASVPGDAPPATEYTFELTVGNGTDTDSAAINVSIKAAVFEDFTPDINDDSILDTSEGIAFNQEGMWVVSTEGILSLFDTGGNFVKKYDIAGLPVGANFDTSGKLVVALNSLGLASAIDTSDGSGATVAEGLGTANYPLPDKDGNLFVSNRQNQAVFRHDAALDETVPFVEDLGINPNSIGFGPEPDVLYVGTRSTVWRVPILEDGSAGTPEVYLDLANGSEVDGLWFDEGRNMYVGCPGTAGLYIAPYVASGATGVARSFLDVGGGISIFTNLTHAPAAFGETALYYTNLGGSHVGRIDVGLPRLLMPLAVPPTP